ncbi:HNH endonuclease signature motif containing protein [Mycobacteroides abscessus]|uniref:HNH endonuclease signature motif containing protein n=1 Tax=Mycobacteroides abscessus TaxID=36809 RepID=UPI000241D07A|nr:HNH endonuclease signature motif containing protein [Mycobacteroides abscessus]EHM19373.1 hypothetical protein MBOL_24390 [Mycobacteroides abscessus subsp. bolletii BD]ORA26730.1 HNH endonuclease [Mycobacteroides abscessus subsp. bolletii]TPF69582.1 hypothetical protein XW60_02670 [Mycobacteroides abscessus subsp. bolletii]BBB41930.1 hypothetical protein MASB_24960 [Mycobacteroides abscessus subsp. bolletii BD]
MFDTLGDGELIDVIMSSQRAEAQAASCRLSAIGVFVDRHADLEREHPRDRFAVDRWDEVAAQVAAAQGVTRALASHQMRYAYVLRHRLRGVADRFAAGDIDFRTVALIIGRTELVEDEVVAALDTAIVTALPRWERWSVKRITAALDALIYRHDRDAVRRTKTAADDRHLEIRSLDTGDPLAEIWGVLQSPHAVALDMRLNQLARTVCAADPWTQAQRRADAIGALTQGLDQMCCACGGPGCSGRAISDIPVVVHMVANQDTLENPESPEPAQIAGFGVINAAQARQIAEQPGTRIRALDGATDTEGYRPSRDLDRFVRCRDETCRFPGCSQPAESADLDHSIPYAIGGHTSADNLKALCRKHHLLKTFCGWREIQEPDGTIVWKAPTRHTYVTTPASGLLFANLTRSRTRAQDRKQRRITERNLNRCTRLQREDARLAYTEANPPPF